MGEGIGKPAVSLKAHDGLNEDLQPSGNVNTPGAAALLKLQPELGRHFTTTALERHASELAARLLIFARLQPARGC